MNTVRLSISRGFSLIELLIVAAVIGLITAISIPNPVNAIQRSRQSRSLADAQAIGKGLSMYQQDFVIFPIAAEDTYAEELRLSLTPYMSNYSPLDGWMRPFLYTSTEGEHYTVVSYGLDVEETLPYPGGHDELFCRGHRHHRWHLQALSGRGAAVESGTSSHPSESFDAASKRRIGESSTGPPRLHRPFARGQGVFFRKIS